MTKFCPDCGFENNDSAKFCKKCGSALQETRIDSGSNYDKPKSNNNTLIIVITAIICIVIVAGALVYLNNNSNETTDTVNNVAVQEKDYGVSFDEACSDFSEASSTVVKHVFDESDADGDGYLNDDEMNTFEDVKKFTKKWVYDIKNDDEVDTPDLWNGDGSIRTRYCADHGRIAVADDDLCPYCEIKGYSDTRTRKDSTKYV